MTDAEALTYRSTLPGLLGRLDNTICKLESFLLAAGVLLMALNTCVNVVARFVFGEGLFFSGEINRILIVLITFSGIGYAARYGRHIRMSAIYDALSFKTRKLLMTVICFFTALVMFALAYFACEYIASIYQRGRILPALGIQIWWIYIWVPLGFLITGIQYALTLFKNITSSKVYLSAGVPDEYTKTEKDI
ncbi:C4-dicarboxylate ABC transporter permease [Vibrio panuliri]|uniref:TRAP transporter small permease protein n=1 Tax=Vibrio panuliri TaxID=1381081 RepID=A0A1Q9HES2_9VIBR|nr:TRAP transporter small permease [Vibrio panuliri]OLQ88233.1 C4-dicarboxylate ABC transporter permease [Vibrio panuliri]